jgi:hypothetical protein
MTDDQFTQDADAVRADLDSLKHVLEARRTVRQAIVS